MRCGSSGDVIHEKSPGNDTAIYGDKASILCRKFCCLVRVVFTSSRHSGGINGREAGSETEANGFIAS